MMRTHYVGELSPGMDGQEVILAGWVHEVRDIGKIKFVQLRDRSGIAQVTAKKGVASEEVMKAMSLVKESVVQIRGTVQLRGTVQIRGRVRLRGTVQLRGRVQLRGMVQLRGRDNI